jgi:hypothetical protein
MFDYETLVSIIKKQLLESNVNVVLETSVRACMRDTIANHEFIVDLTNGIKLTTNFVVNATYANLNAVNAQFGVQPQSLLYEDVTIPVFGFDMHPMGLTIMDGEYCTIMPHGMIKNQFLLYHVRSSVRHRSSNIADIRASFNEDNENLKLIYSDSVMYMPFIKHVKKISCRRAIRAVFENANDARLSEIHTYQERPGFISVLSGKISTASQTAIHVRHMIENKPVHTRYFI